MELQSSQRQADGCRIESPIAINATGDTLAQES